MEHAILIVIATAFVLLLVSRTHFHFHFTCEIRRESGYGRLTSPRRMNGNKRVETSGEAKRPASPVAISTVVEAQLYSALLNLGCKKEKAIEASRKAAQIRGSFDDQLRKAITFAA